MDLMCAEIISSDNCCATKDCNIFDDDRVLRELLNMEHLYIPHCDYFKSTQSEVEPYMRKVVTKWMLEICEILNCEDQVFPLAVNMFDRFLCSCNTPKKFLQLIAADCLLVASKIRQAVTISVDTLCYYTNYSVTASQIRRYELLLVSKLNWNLLAITGYDFVDYILQRINWSKQSEMIRRHSLILLHLCYTECEFMRMKPSSIATICIISAMKGLKIKFDCDIFRHICLITNSSEELVTEAVNRLEWFVAKEASLFNNHNIKVTSTNNCSSTTEKTVPVISEGEKPVTPRDVQDVEF